MASVNPVTSGIAKALGGVLQSKPVKVLTKKLLEQMKLVEDLELVEFLLVRFILTM